MKLYVVKDWDALFETAETRKLQALTWWPKRNKHDGLGYRRLAAHRQKVSLYSAWVLLCDLASKTEPKEKRGRLERNGLPLTPEDMACITGFPIEIFIQALTFFTAREVGWLECLEESTETADSTTTAAFGPASPDAKPVSPAIPALHPGTPGEPPATPVLNGMEGNGMEQKGRERASPAARFTPPEWEEVRFHAEKIGLPQPEALKFWSFYGSNGWRVGKNPMRDWHKAIAGWKVRWEVERSQPGSLQMSLEEKNMAALAKRAQRLV